MVNLRYLLGLYFRSDDSLLQDERIIALLDRDLDLEPDSLAIHIYRVQRELLQLYSEAQANKLLIELSYLQRILTQAEIYYTANIGDNFRLVHGLGTVIGARVTLGESVTVYQGVTVGSKSSTDKHRPTIGDHSVLYAGCRVLGAVTLGKNCIVGANSLVLSSFPDGSIIAGTPAHLVHRREQLTDA